VKIKHHVDVGTALDFAAVTRALETAGCVAADEEAEELVQTAHGDNGELRRMLARRLTGEPLAWITGRANFCGLDVAIEPGVYVPRWQSEPLALMAARLLPPTGLGVDLCTGAGAIAMVMRSACPEARIVATEIDPLAANCARRNGLVVYEGDLDEPLPAELASRVDVMTGVLPYVPHGSFHFLPRDVQRFEPRRALDGGEGGVEKISTVVRRSPRWIRSGGWLLLEIGNDQVAAVSAMLAGSGYSDIDVLEDDDGDPRGVCGRLDP
jgi:release factor glutamine methyltransferase